MCTLNWLGRRGDILGVIYFVCTLNWLGRRGDILCVLLTG